VQPADVEVRSTTVQNELVLGYNQHNLLMMRRGVILYRMSNNMVTNSLTY
jgi:hypothetical protein